MLYHMPSGRSQVELGENTNQLDKNIIILEREKKIIMRLPLRPQLSIKACCAPEPSPVGRGAGGGGKIVLSGDLLKENRARPIRTIVPGNKKRVGLN